MVGKVQDDKAFHTLPSHLLIFVITCFPVRNKLKKINEKRIKIAILGNLTMRVPLLYFNLLLVSKFSLKRLYIKL